MAIGLPTARRNAACDSVVDAFDAGTGAGTIQIRSGARPATADDAATGTLLATVVLVDPAFGAAAAGAATITDPGPVTGTTAGTASWFRGLDSAGATVMDGSVTDTGGGGDLKLNAIEIVVGVNVDVTGGGTITMSGL